MASVLDSVNQRTQLVGQNRLELLLFTLASRQRYGINVFKVREVLQCPKLTQMPHHSPIVRGVAYIRGQTISIIDLNMAVGGAPLDDLERRFIIISEYNRTVQGFLVGAVERIVNTNWSDIHPPPKGTGKQSYLTAVTEIDKTLVEIIDVEKILSELIIMNEDVSEGTINEDTMLSAKDFVVLIVDDSSVARNQIKRTMEQVGVQTMMCKNGKEALDLLTGLADDGQDIYGTFAVVISDIEMPEMDGYTLTAAIRNDPRLQKLHVLLHTSLSGVFNRAMVEKVGANDFIAKFHPDSLATAVQKQVELRIKENS
ncbi:MAG: chemotaxis protein CheW [Kangiellaceae bacterium]|jgi:two-component system chemotaxis response regulator CheV|nr:chemotaxis protein CheW [Kangiellaceae bacterium]|tara:strand:+ start:4876 stop:5814 length:939 start_codon:yes stop_codon:yes gene_type:complete